MRLYVCLSLAALLAVGLAVTGCEIRTSAGKTMDEEFAALQQRVAKIEAQSNDIQSRFDQSTKVAGEAVLGFTEMQQEVSILQGKVDEFSRQQLSAGQVTLLRRQLARQFQAIDQRLADLEKKAGIKNADRGNLDDFANPGAPLVPQAEKPTEEGLFKEGVALFNQGNLEAAKARFREFLGQFKKSQYRPDAQYYLAQSLFKQQNWEEAILEFDTLVSQYPQSKRVPEAYLNMGIAFYQKGQTADARLFFEKVVQQFPSSKEADIARKKLQTIK
jgi:tol-pal system protein YbgF